MCEKVERDSVSIYIDSLGIRDTNACKKGSTLFVKGPMEIHVWLAKDIEKLETNAFAVCPGFEAIRCMPSIWGDLEQ